MWSHQYDCCNLVEMRSYHSQWHAGSPLIADDLRMVAATAAAATIIVSDSSRHSPRLCTRTHTHTRMHACTHTYTTPSQSSLLSRKLIRLPDDGNLEYAAQACPAMWLSLSECIRNGHMTPIDKLHLTLQPVPYITTPDISQSINVTAMSIRAARQLCHRAAHSCN